MGGVFITGSSVKTSIPTGRKRGSSTAANKRCQRVRDDAEALLPDTLIMIIPHACFYSNIMREVAFVKGLVASNISVTHIPERNLTGKGHF